MDLTDLESVYASMIRRSHGGNNVASLASPALSTQFVKSSHTNKASANMEGALAQIIFPSRDDIEKRLQQRFGDKHKALFTYDTSKACAAYPAGYGERSAQAIERESSIYQLKGVFPKAAQSLALLRARVAGRGGDVSCLNKLFALLWDVPLAEVEQLPSRSINGSEATRMAAMEDRAYHSLAGHPAYTGGFRVDMATIAPDQLGIDVPLNWARIRTGLKMVACIQSSADLELQSVRQKLPGNGDIRFCMDLAVASQPRYRRSDAWELVIDKLLGAKTNPLTDNYAVEMTMASHCAELNLDDVEENPELQRRIASIAQLVSEKSNESIAETIMAFTMFDHDKALIADSHDLEHDELAGSDLAKKFNVPEQMVMRDTLKFGTHKEYIGEDKLPDIVSHGKGQMRLDPKELRSAGMMRDLTPGGALHLAVYIAVSQRNAIKPGYKLVHLVRDPSPGEPGPVTARLRKEAYFSSADVRSLGPYLFGEAFMSSLESIVANMLSKNHFSDVSLVNELWKYLTDRCKKKRPCPSNCGLRDLIRLLYTAPEGWSLYYWARCSLGKLHHAMSSSVLAPIAAGEEVEFLELMKRGARSRAQYWAAYYSVRTEAISDRIAENRKQQRDVTEAEWTEASKKFIAPRMKNRLYFELHYDKEAILSRLRGYTVEEYKAMVEYQVKAKIFQAMEITTKGRELAVGLSDSKVLDLLIEFYQSRWLSLEVRINKAIERGEVFKLGTWELPVHPWGDLITAFPDTAREMMEISLQLDQRAWTVDPKYLWEKIRKSIGELWDDLAREINLITAFIDDKIDCAPDSEVDIIMDKRVQDECADLLPALKLNHTIVISAPGYRSPYDLPEKLVQLSKGPQLYAAGTYLEPEPTPPQTTVTNGYEDDDSDDDFMPIMPSRIDYSKCHTTAVHQEKYLTYRELWDVLELPDVDDIQKKVGFALSVGMSLDDEHLDSAIGPLVLSSELSRARRIWLGKLPFINKRLSGAIVATLDDDM